MEFKLGRSGWSSLKEYEKELKGFDFKISEDEGEGTISITTLEELLKLQDSLYGVRLVVSQSESDDSREIEIYDDYRE